MFKVEKGIPVQSVSRAGHSKYVQFLKELPVGASFSETQDGEPVTAAKVAVVRQYARKMGIKVCARKIDEDAYRVWRVDGRGNAPKRKRRKRK